MHYCNKHLQKVFIFYICLH